MSTYLAKRIAKLIGLMGITKLAIATAEVIMIIMLLTSPACCADCPRMSPPTVVAVEPIYLGKRRLASKSASIIKSMMITSTKEG
ncbi:hypothetical protein D3C85_1258810 [compost metagenome]